MQKILAVFKNHKKTIVFLIVALIIMGASQVFSKMGKKEVVVITGNVLEDKFEQSVFATGTLEVKNKQEIFAEITSPIEKIFVKPGEKVKTGQVILKLDADDLILKVAEAQATYDAKRMELISLESNLRTVHKELELVKKDYERKKVLFEMGAISQQELELAEKNMTIEQENLSILQEAKLPLIRSQLEEAKIALQKAKNTLNKATITSPTDGTVLSLPVKEQHPIQVGMLLVSIGNLNELQIETGINEVDAADLKVGDLVEITSEGILENAFIGHIEYVAPIAELERTSQGEQTQVKIRVAVDEVDNSKLKPGYNVNLKIILNEKDNVTLVPYEAITQRENKDVAFVVDKEGNVFEREVKLGLSNALFFEVLSGLKKGEKVILNPTVQIKEGVRVKVNDRNK